MSASFNQALAAAACIAMLGVAVWRDVVERRIPNAAVMAGAATAVLLAAAPGGIGAANALLGLVTGLVLLMPLNALHVLGGGDVKLFAAVSAFAGLPGLFTVGLYTLLAGGILAAGWLALSRTHAAASPRVPYAVAIALGALAYLIAGVFA